MSRLVAQALFLALDVVFLGGAAGKGYFAIGTDGQILLCFRQLSFRNFALRLARILDTLAPARDLRQGSAIQTYLSPVIRGFEQLLESLRVSRPAD